MSSSGVVILLFGVFYAAALYYSNYKANAVYRKMLNDKFNHYKKYVL